MFIGLNWRGLLEGGGVLGNAVLKEFESLMARISAWSNVEHDDDGTHTDITAQSVEVSAASIDYAINVLSGLSALGGGIAFPGVITPDQIVANQNNYAPTGLDGAFCLRLSTDASRNITGMLAPPPAAGRLVLVVNVGANDVVLKHENASSAAENRFNFSGSTDVTLTALSTLLVYYDSTVERWIALGGSGSGGTTPHDFLSVTHPDTSPAAPLSGAIITAERTLGNAVDNSKFWAKGRPFGAISTTINTGTLAYWTQGNSGLWLPPSVSASAPLWTRKTVGAVGQVLGVILEAGDLKAGWVDPSSGGGSTGARAYRSTDLSTAYNIPTPVPLSSTEFDTGGYWSAGAPTGFTIPSAGLYVVVGQATWENAGSGLLYEEIFVNGVKTASSESTFSNVSPSVGDYDPGQVSALLRLAAGDFVSFSVRSVRFSGANVVTLGGQSRTWFAIARLEGGGASSGGGATLPIRLTTDVTDVLPIGNGGTGQTAVGSDGQVVKVVSGGWVPSTIQEADIADGTILARLASNETITGAYTFSTNPVLNDNALPWSKISKAGSSLADLATRSAGDLSSGTLADARLSTNVPLKNVAETISGAWGFTPGVKERGRAVAMGEWTAVAHDAANFTASGSMTWTVEAADQVSFGYMIIGKTMFVRFTLNGTSVGGTVSTELRIRIPAGGVAAAAGGSPTIGAIRSFDNGTDTVGFCGVVAGATYIRCWRGGFTNWALSTNNTSVQGTAMFEID